MNITTIQLKMETKQRLSHLGTVSETYDSVINQLLDHVEKCSLWIENMRGSSNE